MLRLDNRDPIKRAVTYNWDDPQREYLSQEQGFVKNVSKFIADHIVYNSSKILDFLTKNHQEQNQVVSTQIEADYDYYIDRMDANVHRQDIILFLNASSDKYGAFKVSPSNFIELEKESGYKVVVRKVSTLQNIEDEVTQLYNQANRIKAIGFRGHGLPNLIVFGDSDNKGMNSGELSNDLSLSEEQRQVVEKFLKRLIKKIDPHAPFFLEACSTGKPLEGQENLAQFIARVTKSHPVFAPSRTSISKYNQRTITYSKEEGFKAHFHGIKLNTFFKHDDMLGRLQILWNMTFQYYEDITVLYKHEETPAIQTSEQSLQPVSTTEIARTKEILPSIYDLDPILEATSHHLYHNQMDVFVQIVAKASFDGAKVINILFHDVIANMAERIFFYMARKKQELAELEAQNNHEDYDQYVSQETPQISNQSIILVLTGEEENSLKIPASNFLELEKESGFKVVTRIVRTLQDIAREVNTLKKNTNKIELLWIRVKNGTPDTLQFSKNDYYKDHMRRISIRPDFTSNKHEILQIDFLKTLLSNVEPNGPVVLEAHSVGKRTEERPQSLAQYVAKHANGRLVYAPTRAISDPFNKRMVSYSAEDGFKVNFRAIKTNKRFQNGTLAAKLEILWNLHTLQTEDITIAHHNEWFNIRFAQSKNVNTRDLERLTF